MKVYNVLHRKKEEFIPINSNEVKMYVCGMTINGLAHLGHARQAITFDMIYKYLKLKGYNVKYASNYTDVDDKLVLQAKQMGISPVELADERIEKINTTWKNLGVSEPDYRPRVTKTIPQIIEFIENLIKKGFAYETGDGDVYFDVKKFHGYGMLSNRKIDELIDSVRIESADNKRDTLDFALWKHSAGDDFGFSSPWGIGRPGWHIECSTMIKTYLGDQIDIHGGGKDLIFPHHENEIAQSYCANDCDLAKYWLHNGLITINGQKMSKSLGNFMLVDDVLKTYDSEVIRLAILTNHYTSTQDLGDDALALAEKNLYYFYNMLQDISQFEISENMDLVNKFFENMDDDFNSSKVIADLFVACSNFSKAKNSQNASIIASCLPFIQNVLGIFKQSPSQFIQNIKQKYLKILGINSIEIEQAISCRQNAKLQKNYVLADDIRNKLLDKGIILKDTKTQTTWDIKQLY